MTNARQRMLFGRTTPCTPSRFLKEIPEKNMEWLSRPQERPIRESWGEDWGDAAYGGYGYSGERTATRAAAPVFQSRPHPAASPAKRAAAPVVQLQAGDGVVHDAFGRGMVLSVRPMGGDALLEVAFDKVGTKKLMLRAASQHLTKE